MHTFGRAIIRLKVPWRRFQQKPEPASETRKDFGGVDMKALAVLGLFATLLTSASSASAADYELKLVPSNTHSGAFDAELKPVLRIASGDTVTVEAVVSGGMDRLIAAGASDGEIPDSLKTLDKYMKEKRIAGGTLTGPIYVEGAQTGDVSKCGSCPASNSCIPTAGPASAARARYPTTSPTRATSSTGSTSARAPSRSRPASR